MGANVVNCHPICGGARRGGAGGRRRDRLRRGLGEGRPARRSASPGRQRSWQVAGAHQRLAHHQLPDLGVKHGVSHVLQVERKQVSAKGQHATARSACTTQAHMPEAGERQLRPTSPAAVPAVPTGVCCCPRASGMAIAAMKLKARGAAKRHISRAAQGGGRQRTGAWDGCPAGRRGPLGRGRWKHSCRG